MHSEYRTFVRDYVSARGGVAMLEEAEKTALVGVLREGVYMNNDVVLFTGFRDAELSSAIVNLGGKVANNWSRKITMLIHKDGLKANTAKLKKAREAGVSIMSKSEFERYIGY